MNVCACIGTAAKPSRKSAVLERVPGEDKGKRGRSGETGLSPLRHSPLDGGTLIKDLIIQINCAMLFVAI